MAQLASASGLGPEGPVFESQYPDKEEAKFVFSFFCARSLTKKVILAEIENSTGLM